MTEVKTEVEEQPVVEEPVEAEEQPRRASKISDPASMKTDEEITAQIEYVKYITKRVSIVIAIASALIILGVVFGK